MFDHEWDITALKRQLEIEIAQAEMVIATNENGRKKPHEPTVAYFQGQENTARKILARVEELHQAMPFGLWLSPKALAIIAAGGIMVWLLH
jgi:hypothetical protein